MPPSEAAQLYLERLRAKFRDFETMDSTNDSELNYVRMINAGAKFEYNNVNFGYISHRIVFYLMNLHIKHRRTFFARAGTSTSDANFKTDASLCEEGKHYAEKMSAALVKHREDERAELIKKGGSDAPLKPLTVWTSTRKRTVETAEFLAKRGHNVMQRSQLGQLHPGICADLSERAIKTMYAKEVELHEKDPYHHRYPRAEVCLARLFH